MIQVDDHSSLLELAHQSFCSDCVAEEQMGRVLVVHKVAGGVACGLSAPLLHRDAVVRLVLYDRHPIRSQPVLLPLSCVRRHVHGRLEAELGAHDADGEPQVACGADRDLVLAEELASRIGCEGFVAIADADQPSLQGKILRMLEHFMDATARLDRSGDGQIAVRLEP
ncbi:hypothetical protein D9M68_578470 [compost metagenome]